jgi:hypothetical protein
MSTRIFRSLFLFLFLDYSLLWADILVLSDGQILKGDFVQITFEEVFFRYEKAELKVPMDRLAPVSLDFIYRHFAKKAKTFEELLQLGQFCEQFDLLTQALSTYRKGEKFKELTEEQLLFLSETLSRIEEKDAQKRFKQALALYTAQELEESLQKFVKLAKLYPQHLLGEEAHKMEIQIREKLDQLQEEKRQQAQKKEKEKPSREAILLQEAYHALSLVDQANIQGLDFHAKQKYHKGTKQYEYAENTLQQIEETAQYLQNHPDPEIQKPALELMQHVLARRLVVFMNFAHLWAVDLNWQKATLYTNRVLAIDPNHPEAKHLRMKITQELIRRNE